MQFELIDKDWFETEIQKHIVELDDNVVRDFANMVTEGVSLCSEGRRVKGRYIGRKFISLGIAYSARFHTVQFEFTTRLEAESGRVVFVGYCLNAVQYALSCRCTVVHDLQDKLCRVEVALPMADADLFISSIGGLV